MEQPELSKRESLLSAQVRKISEKLVDIVCAVVTVQNDRSEDYAAFKGKGQLETSNNSQADNLR